MTSNINKNNVFCSIFDLEHLVLLTHFTFSTMSNGNVPFLLTCCEIQDTCTYIRSSVCTTTWIVDLWATSVTFYNNEGYGNYLTRCIIYLKLN